MKPTTQLQFAKIVLLVLMLTAFVFYFTEIIRWIDCGDLMKGQCQMGLTRDEAVKLAIKKFKQALGFKS